MELNLRTDHETHSGARWHRVRVDSYQPAAGSLLSDDDLRLRISAAVMLIMRIWQAARA